MNKQRFPGYSAKSMINFLNDELAFIKIKHIAFLIWCLFYIGVSLIYNIVLVSSVQQSDSVIHISIIFQVIFPYKFLQNID